MEKGEVVVVIRDSDWGIRARGQMGWSAGARKSGGENLVSRAIERDALSRDFLDIVKVALVWLDGWIAESGTGQYEL